MRRIKAIAKILFVVLFLDIIYSNSNYYISSCVWKQVNDAGRLCGDNIIFDGHEVYERDWYRIKYYGRGYKGETVGYYLFCFNFGFGSRLWVYSLLDNGVGVYRNIINLKD